MNWTFALLTAAALAALALAGWLIRRARPQPAAAAAATGRWADWAGSALAALRYLVTLHQWRYRVPWVMVLGHAAAGKTSLGRSITSGRRQGMLLRERALPVRDTDWGFFDGGVLIDPDGKFSCAEAQSAEGRRWRAILAALDNRRPERPLDAVVLAVSATALLEGPAKQREEAAQLCYRQLWALQKRFDFALPVYVAVTQCDRIDGFAAFWSAQPAARRRELVGWSNPALADGAPAEWMQAAFARLSAGLRDLQAGAAAQAQPIGDVDRFFLFPQRFAALQAPLQGFLETLFQPSAYHASFYFRGVYFAGSVAADGALSGKPRRDVVFLDDLFERRVFGERHLARPTREGVWSRNRLVRNLQIAGVALAVAACAALGAASLRLHGDVEALIASLRSLKAFEADKAAAGGGPQADCFDRESVYALIGAIAKVKPGSFYAAIPLSWFDSRVAADASETIAQRSFGRVILPGLRCRLELRARQLAQPEPQPAPAAAGPAALGAAARRLAAEIGKAGAFEAALGRFHRVASPAPGATAGEQLPLFVALLEELYGAPTPEELHRERGAVGRGLVHARYPRRPRLPGDLGEVVAARIAAGVRELRRVLLDEVRWGERGLRGLDRGRGSFTAQVHRLNAWLAWVGAEWLASSEAANPCRSLEAQLRGELAALPRARYGRFDEVLAELGPRACYRPARTALAEMHVPPLGGVFRAKSDGSGALELAIADELRGLPALVAQPFMQRRGEAAFACRPAAGGWQAKSIADALRFVREYQEFAKSQGVDGTAAAAAKRPFFDRLARGSLHAVLDETINDAQLADEGPEPRRPGFAAVAAADQDLARRAADFAGSLDALLQVLRLMQQLGFADSHAGVTQCVRNFSSGMLLRADALADASRLYDPGSGAAQSAAPADRFFPLGSAAITRDYLGLQLRRSEVLAGYASPFVSFLKNTEGIDDGAPVNSQRAPYWDNTAGELSRYVQFKEPNGQVALLEGFFVKQLSLLSDESCGKILDGYQEAAHGNDLFSERRRALEGQARDLCEDREQAGAYAQYRPVASRFNRQLAGRYPFDAAGAAGPQRPAAQLDVVKSFFTDYDGQRDALRKAVAAMRGDFGREAQRFVERLDEAAAFFRGSLAGAQVSQPLKLDVTFRALRQSSPGAEQLIDWVLRAGERTVRYSAGPASLEYAFGSPLSLELLWASDSKVRPRPDAPQPGLSVRGASALFGADDAWALVRLAQAHRPRAVPPGDPLDPNRLLLEFVVPVSVAQPGAAREGAARVYLGLNLSARDPKTSAPLPVKLPGAFPASAPVTW